MKKVALVLGSGGARGLTQIGVIQYLVERDFEITSIAGCSMGSVIGGVYAAGHLNDFTNWICNLDRFGVFGLMDFTLNAQGFIKGDRVFDEMKKFVDEINIEELPIPYAAVSVDMNREEQVIFRSGDLFSAIRASVSIPSVLTPVSKNGALLVDGGVMNPLPLDIVKRSKDDIVIAVDLNAKGEYDFDMKWKKGRQDELKEEESKWKKAIDKMFADVFKGLSSKKSDKRGYLQLLQGSFDLIQKQLTKIMLSNHKPDILIQVPKKSADTFDFFRAEEMIAYGRHLAEEAIEKYESKSESA